MTPDEWAERAMENAVTHGGMRASIALVARAAIREAIEAERAEYVRRAVESKEKMTTRA